MLVRLYVVVELARVFFAAPLGLTENGSRAEILKFPLDFRVILTCRGTPAHQEYSF